MYEVFNLSGVRERSTGTFYNVENVSFIDRLHAHGKYNVTRVWTCIGKELFLTEYADTLGVAIHIL